MPDEDRLERELAEAAAQAAVLRLRVEELESQRAFDERWFDALRQDRQALRATRDAVATQLTEAQAQAGDHARAATELREERETLTRMVAELEARIETLEVERHGAVDQHRRATERVAYLERELTARTDELRAQSTELQTRDAQLATTATERDADRATAATQAAALTAEIAELQAALRVEGERVATAAATLERQRFEQRALVADLVRAQSTLTARSDQLQRVLRSRWYRVARSSWRARTQRPPLAAVALFALAVAGVVTTLVLAADAGALVAGLLASALVGGVAVAVAVVLPALRDPRVPRMAGEESYARPLTDGPQAPAPTLAAPVVAPATPPAATAPVAAPAARVVTRLVPAPTASATVPDAARRRWLATGATPALRDLRVAGVLDEMSRACFAPECRLDTGFTLEDWREHLEEHPPHLLFVESAWNGNDGGWQYGVASYEHPRYRGLPFLRELIEWCREQGIPTVFWNKEDPVHFERFREAAALFDHIFTTDADCIPAYLELEGEHVQTVQALPFAAQPRLHNPIAVVAERASEPVFAGTYYRTRHVDRQASLEMLLDAARPAGLTIYDRTFGTTSDEFGFPERFTPHIAGRLPYDEVVDTYKRHRVFLNVNSVTESPTMFSRRVFELLACGTAVLSTESAGMTAMFGDLVPVATTPAQANEHLDRLLHDDAYWADLTRRARQRVLAEHTYRERLATVARTAGFDLSATAGDEVSVLVVADRDDDLAPIADALLSQATAPDEVVVGLGGEGVGAADLARLADRFGERRVRTVLQDGDTARAERLRALATLAAGPWVAPMRAGTAYDEHHLRDLLACVRFADADVVGPAPADDHAAAHRYGEATPVDASLATRAVVAGRGWPDDEAALRDWFRQGVRFYVGEPAAVVVAAPSPAEEPAAPAPSRRHRTPRSRRR